MKTNSARTRSPNLAAADASPLPVVIGLGDNSAQMARRRGGLALPGARGLQGPPCDWSPPIRRRAPWVAGFVLLGLAAALPLRAQQITQTFTLQNGWNAIFLSVTPTNGSPAELFAGLPVASVWTLVDKQSAVEFIQDAAEAEFNKAGWLKWYPAPQPEFLNDLRQVQGNRAYLLKLTNAPAGPWQATGQPVARAIQWVTEAWNLRGFPVAPGNPPTFRDYFRWSTNHYNAAQNQLRGVYRLAASGTWVAADQYAAMKAGEACWVYCRGASSFTGPLDVSFDTGEAVDFGTYLDQVTLRFKNLAAGSRTVTLRQLGAAVPGVLAYQRFTPEGFEWLDLPDPFAVDVATNRTLLLGVRRSLFAETDYATILEVTDSQGLRYLAPLSARKIAAARPYAGLWVGSVTVSNVSTPHLGGLTTNRYVFIGDQAAPLDDPRLQIVTNWVVVTNWTLATNADTQVIATNAVLATNAAFVVQTADGAQAPVYEKIERSPGSDTPAPTKSEFSMRLLLHVDDTAGRTCLLKEVVQMWRDGTYTNDAQGNRVADKPGAYVLLTRDDLLSQFKGATLRDGVPVGRRLSAIGFDFDGRGTNHLPLLGTFAPGGSVSNTIQIASDYPLNPFLHRYHPDHDNLDVRFKALTNAPQEAYAVRRDLRFDFDPPAADSGATPDASYTSMTGTYSEWLTGLHKQTIVVRGTFRLFRASHIAELNPSPKP